MIVKLGDIHERFNGQLSSYDYARLGGLIRDHGPGAEIVIASADSQDTQAGYLHKSIRAASKDPRLILPRRWS